VTLTVIDDAGKTDSYSRIVKVKNLQPVAGFEMKADGGAYSTSNIEITNAQTAAQVVWFQSLNPDWDNLTEAEHPNEGSDKPENFLDEKNLAYDPEGQWVGNDGWGITTYLWDFGDGATRTVSANADPITYTLATHNVSGGCPVQTHSYTLADAEQSRTFTVKVEVVDELGARGTLTRTVKLNKD
jgi:hypothetical protein